MLQECRQASLAHFTGTVVERPGVIHDPVIAFGFEVRSTDEDHQVVGFALAGLMEVEKIAGAKRARISAERSRVEVNQRFCIGELGKPWRRARRDLEQR